MLHCPFYACSWLSVLLGSQLASSPATFPPAAPPAAPPADKKVFEQAYSAAFGPAMDICYEIYEDGEPSIRYPYVDCP